MKPVNEIYADFLLQKVPFHKREETEVFYEALKFFMDQKYNVSANMSAVLYERIFTTRLIDATANPSGFVASKENIAEQFVNLTQRENQVINVHRLTFRAITEQLVSLQIITQDEKTEYDTFYREVMNPVSHGLSSRIFENAMGRKPANPLETDVNYENIYRDVAHKLIDKIYYLMAVRGVRQK